MIYLKKIKIYVIFVKFRTKKMLAQISRIRKLFIKENDSISLIKPNHFFDVFVVLAAVLAGLTVLTGALTTGLVSLTGATF